MVAHLNRHLNLGIAYVNKRNQWSLKWAANNLHCIASLMVRYNLVKDNVLALDENATMLNSLNLERTGQTCMVLTCILIRMKKIIFMHNAMNANNKRNRA